LSEIVLAKHIGFCSGVKRAVNLAFSAARNGQVYSLGPLIHNPQEVKRLEKAGVRVIKNLGNLKAGTLIVRSHGLPERIICSAKKRGLKIIDATCPLVKKVQKIAGQLRQKGYQVVIVGDRYHPEVKAIQERAGRNFLIISDGKKSLKSQLKRRVGVIAQTTQSEDDFREAVKQLKKTNEDVKVYNTICQETARRQKELLTLVKKVDVVLVIGGFNSANTRRLVELSLRAKIRTSHLENSNDLKKIDLKGVRKIGIITGASTPNWMVEKVVENLSVKKSKNYS